MSAPLRACVLGARGRMGKMVIEALAERADDMALASSADQGDDLAAAIGAADVVIDFSAPEATARAAALAAERGVALVVGTTGLGESERRALETAAARVAVVQSPNFSVGVNLLLGLVERAARALPGWDLEVVEAHHKHKRDAPSGTALAIGEALARGRGVRLSDVVRLAREGDTGARSAAEIGIVAVRGGDVVGDHTAHFLGPAERIEITHRAGSRAIFARGAVHAALWTRGRSAGLYGMKDVLGL